MKPSLRTSLILASLGLLALARGGTYAFSSDGNQGWYTDHGVHWSYNPNYFVGLDPTAEGGVYRDFFSFDLSGLDLSAQTVVGVSLTVYEGYAVGTDPHLFELRAVATPVATLRATHDYDGAEGIAAYDDLAAGALYGDFPLANAQQNTEQTLVLNASAVAGATAAAGEGAFSLGGSLVNASAFQDYAFGYLGTTPLVVLTVQTVPEPGPIAALALGLFGLRRKRGVKS